MAQVKTTTTNPLLKPVQFATEVKREIKKVNWPTRRETVATTVIVLMLVALCAAVLFPADQAIAWAVKTILQAKG